MKKLLTLLVGLLAFSSVSLAVSFSLPTDIQKKKDQLLPIVNLILNSNEYTEEQKNMVKTILSNCAANNKNEIIKNTCLVIVEELRPEEEKTDEITILQKRMDEISNDLKALGEPINKDRLGYTTNPKAVKLRCEYDKSKTRIQEINENRKIIDVVVFYGC